MGAVRFLLGLPVLKSRRRYEAGLVDLPTWRITCVFTGRGHRRRGVADSAIGGALAMSAVSEAVVWRAIRRRPTTDDRRASGSFLHNGPMSAFERHGFVRQRPISPHRWVVARQVG